MLFYVREQPQLQRPSHTSGSSCGTVYEASTSTRPQHGPQQQQQQQQAVYGPQLPPSPSSNESVACQQPSPERRQPNPRSDAQPLTNGHVPHPQSDADPTADAAGGGRSVSDAGPGPSHDTCAGLPLQGQQQQQQHTVGGVPVSASVAAGGGQPRGAVDGGGAAAADTPGRNRASAAAATAAAAGTSCGLGVKDFAERKRKLSQTAGEGRERGAKRGGGSDPGCSGRQLELHAGSRAAPGAAAAAAAGGGGGGGRGGAPATGGASGLTGGPGATAGEGAALQVLAGMAGMPFCLGCGPWQGVIRWLCDMT